MAAAPQSRVIFACARGVILLAPKTLAQDVTPTQWATELCCIPESYGVIVGHVTATELRFYHLVKGDVRRRFWPYLPALKSALDLSGQEMIYGGRKTRQDMGTIDGTLAWFAENRPRHIQAYLPRNWDYHKPCLLRSVRR